MLPFKFELGSLVKDNITGITGIAMARNEYLTSCNTYGILRRELDKDGKSYDWIWRDETRLILVEKGVIKMPAVPPVGERGGLKESYPDSR